MKPFVLNKIIPLHNYKVQHKIYSEKYFWSSVVTEGSYVMKLLMIIIPEKVETHTTVIWIYAKCFLEDVSFFPFYDFKSDKLKEQIDGIKYKEWEE